MSQGSTPEIEVVRSFLKALEAKDLELALSYVSDEVAYQNMRTIHLGERGASSISIWAPTTLPGFRRKGSVGGSRQLP